MGGMTDIPAADIGNGLEIPMLGFGTWQLHGQDAYNAVRWALEIGYRHLDTATIYRNEAEVGRALRDSGVDRDDVFITTKIPPGNAGRERQTLADSLKALGTSHVDLWLIHWPPRRGALTETWRQLVSLQQEGLTRSIGVSNYSVAQADQLTKETGHTPAVNQIPWSPSGHDPGLLQAFRDRGIVVEGYSPLKDTRLSHPVLTAIAAGHNVSAAQVVLRWHIQLGIIVIPRSKRRERVQENFDLFGFTLTDEEMERIASI
jgi:2,5-diketo-D-gluconate reductase A